MENAQISEKYNTFSTCKFKWEISNYSDISPIKNETLKDFTKKTLLVYDNTLIVSPLCIKLYENLLFIINEEFDPNINKVSDLTISVIRGKNDEYKIRLNKDLGKNYSKKDKSSKTNLEVFFNKYDMSYICFILIDKLYIILSIFLHRESFKLIFMNEFKEGRNIPVQYLNSFYLENEVNDSLFHKGILKVFKYNLCERILFCKDIEIQLDFDKIGIEKIYQCDLTLCNIIFSSLRRKNLYIYNYKSGFLQKISSCYKGKIIGLYFIRNRPNTMFLNSYLNLSNNRVNFITLHSDKSVKLWEISGNSDAVIPVNLLQNLKLSNVLNEDYNYDFIIEGYHAILHLKNQKKMILFSICIKESQMLIHHIHEFSTGEMDSSRFLRFSLLVLEEEELKMKIINFSNNSIIEYIISKVHDNNVVIPTLINSNSNLNFPNYNREFITISRLIEKEVILPSLFDNQLKEKLDKSILDNNKLIDIIHFSFDCRSEKADYDKKLMNFLAEMIKAVSKVKDIEMEKMN